MNQQPQDPNAPVFAGQPPQGAPQLPPQMFTTAAQLLDLTDSMPHRCNPPLTHSTTPNAPWSPKHTHTLTLQPEKLLLTLRDGRKLLGVLRSWDQFANLVLTDTKERYFCVAPSTSITTTTTTTTATNASNNSSKPQENIRRLYCDIPRGTYLVRGENVLLIGEVDLDRDDEPPPGFEVGEVEEVFALQREVERERRVRDKVKGRRVGELWGGEMEGSGEVLF